MRAPPIFSATLLLVLAGSTPARADEAAAKATATLTAVQLAEEAGEHFQAGRYAEALKGYQGADALVKRHTIGVRIARCLVKLGRLAEAVVAYRTVTAMALPTDLEADKLAKQKEALAQAEAERDALLPRIPHVIVQLKGPEDTVILLDGERLPPALLGVKRAIDPGPHHLEARAGAAVATRDLTVKEGEIVPVELEPRVPAGNGAPQPLPVPKVENVPPQPLPPIPPLPAEPPPDPGKKRRIAGYALLGVGGAGLVLGAVTGGVAANQHGNLVQQGCMLSGSTLQCPNGLGTDVNNYNGMRGLSAVGLYAGGAVAATGLVLVLTALPPKAEGAKEAAAAFFVGPASLGVKGSF
jgi:hypothetical protein